MAAFVEFMRLANSGIDSVSAVPDWHAIQNKLVHWLRKERDRAELQTNPELDKIERLNSEIRDCTEQIVRREKDRRVMKELLKLSERSGDAVEQIFENFWIDVFRCFRRDSLPLLSKAEFVIQQASEQREARDLPEIRTAIRDLDARIREMDNADQKWSQSLQKIKYFFQLEQ